MEEAVRFEPGTRIQEALDADGRVGETLRRLGLKCLDRSGEACVAAESETLADAARYHGIGLEAILNELNGLKIRRKPGAGNPKPEA
jgi:hypothetical protein